MKPRHNSNIKLKEFNDKIDAFDWVESECDHDCVDNLRIADPLNKEEMDRYDEQCRQGCCGFFDTKVLIKGTEFLIGCNYGH